MTVARAAPGLTALGGRLYVVGGEDGLRTTEVYDPATDSWTAGPELEVGRSNFAMSVVNGAVYAVGGDANQSRSGVLVGVETLRP